MQRENTEWCRLTWNQAPRHDLPRILLIGDSIANGYHPHVVKALGESTCVDLLATSKGIDDPGLLAETRYMLEGYNHRLIQVNNGLHGWHLSTATYEDALATYLDTLRDLAPEARLIWCQSTPVWVRHDPATLSPERNPQVIARNQAAARAAEQRELPILDLYAITEPQLSWRSQDGFHYLEEGQRGQGQAVAGVLRDYLSAPSRP